MNRLFATICAVETHGSIALIDAAVGDQVLTATLIGASDEIAGWSVGMQVSMLFKETEVSLAKNLTGLISMRNRMRCKIVAIERGKLLTRVVLDFDGHVIGSVITTRSSHVLSLAVGDVVDALVKANEMTVLPEAAK